MQQGSTSRTKSIGLLGHRIVAALGPYPLLYRPYRSIISNAYRRRSLVHRNTDLCVEAPPGSGNSFFVHAFRMVNPSARVAHHHHVGAQLLMAERWQVPTLVFIRDPVASALSRATAWDDPGIGRVTLEQWVRFFRVFGGLERRVPLVRFETMTADPSSVVGLINREFGSGFDPNLPDPQAVFDDMDRSREERFGHEDVNPVRPSDAKSSRQSRLLPVIEAMDVAETARTLYRDLLPRAQ